MEGNFQWLQPSMSEVFPQPIYLKYCEDKDLKEVKKICTQSGGFVSHLGVSDALEVFNRAQAGDKYAKMLWDTMIYQICKCIGSMAVTLHGKLDGILLGGGMAYNEDMVRQIRELCQWIAPVTAWIQVRLKWQLWQQEQFVY